MNRHARPFMGTRQTGLLLPLLLLWGCGPHGNPLSEAIQHLDSPSIHDSRESQRTVLRAGPEAAPLLMRAFAEEPAGTARRRLIAAMLSKVQPEAFTVLLERAAGRGGSEDLADLVYWPTDEYRVYLLSAPRARERLRALLSPLSVTVAVDRGTTREILVVRRFLAMTGLEADK